MKKSTGKAKTKSVQTTVATEKPKRKNLYQILGDNGLQKYGTLNPEEYRARLEKMNESDLREEAQKYGYKTIHGREITINYLMGEFYNYTNTFADSGTITPSIPQHEIKNEKLKQILRDAR